MQQVAVVFSPKELDLEEEVSQNVKLLNKNREQKEIELSIEIPFGQ
jgi:hypothetical protein